jgi:DNA helicase-2/ATP-dependent DNA helicase PcrA
VETAIFEERYANLNTQQKEAVNAIDGPVMVVAGPGTGKTEILSARICNILLKTDTQANNILCLTYTDAGTVAMRKRLTTFMGDEAYKVNIHTFHSLCSKILQDFPSFFNDKIFNVMDDLEKKKIIEGLLISLPQDNPLYTSVLKSESGGAYNYNDPLNSVAECFNILTDNNISKENIENAMQQVASEEDFETAFPNLAKKKGGIYSGKKEAKEEQWAKLLAAAELLPEYNKIKQERSLADFSDLLNWVYEKLKTDDDLLLMVQERYQYILVDEFQDTSPLQAEILYKLLSFFEDNPNCFVVGDDDQSIYSFQGANVGNMMNFYERYKTNIKLISLTENYRSSSKVLEVAGELIKINTDRLVGNISEISKNLVAKGKFASENIAPVFYPYTSSETQCTAVVLKVKELIAGGTNPAEIAILGKNNKFLEIMSHYLKVNDIDYELARTKDLLQEQLVQELITWLEFLNAENKKPDSGGVELFRLMHISNMDTLEVQKLFYHWENHKSAVILEELVAQESNTFDLFKPSFAPWAKNVLTLIREWNSMPAPEFIQLLYNSMGFVKNALAAKNNKHQLQVLYGFMEFVQENSKNNPFENLNFHLGLIREYKNYGVPIKGKAIMGSTEAVKLSTMHSSKGLEFEHVFILNVDEKGFKLRNRETFGVNSLFNNALRTHQNLPDAKSDVAAYNAELELRRLWYVAITRAKIGLYLYAADSEPYEKINEITAHMETRALDNLESAVLKNISLIMGGTGEKAIKLDKDWLKKRIDNYVFSASSLTSILHCENDFYYSRLLSIPSSGNVYMVHGNAIHTSLDKLTKLWNLGKENRISKEEAIMSKEDFIKAFKEYWYLQRGVVSKEQYNLKLKEGEIQLGKYYDQRIHEIFEYDKVMSEEGFETKIADIPFKGKVDKIYFKEVNGNRNHFVITDYKSGNFKSSEKKFASPGDKARKNIPFNIKDNEYWVQAVLYAYMLKQLYPNWEIGGIELDVISPTNENLEVLHNPVTKDDLEFVELLVKRAEEKLKSPSFPSSCGKDNCDWCSFTKTYMPPAETNE